jgi:GT2 family glycosyltransferase
VFSDDDRLVHPDFVRAHIAAFGEASSDGIEPVVLGQPHGILAEIHAPGTETGSREDLSIYYGAVARILRVHPEWASRIARNETFDTFTAAEVERDLLGIFELLAFEERWVRDFVGRAVSTFGGDLDRCSYAWAFAATGNMSVGRRTLASVGGFDDRFVGWGLEDTELHYRLVRAGASTRFATEAINYHQNHRRNYERDWYSWLLNARRMYDMYQDDAITVWLASVITSGTRFDARLSQLEMDTLIRQIQGCEGEALASAFRRLLGELVLQLLETQTRASAARISAAG